MISARPKALAISAEQRSIPGNGTVTPPYKPTPAEAAALDRYRDRHARRPPARIKVAKRKTGVSSRPDHPTWRRAR